MPALFHRISQSALLIGSLALFGCGSDADAGKTVIRYARWGTPEEITAEKELIRLFESRNPGVKVEIEFASWSEYWNKLQAQMAAGSAPDVILMGGTHIHDYAKRGQLVNLNDYAGGTDGIQLSDYYDASVEVFKFDDALWAVPRDCNTIGIYYNKALFDKYGVPYPKPDWTWEDFHAKAKALTHDDDGDGRIDSYGYLASFESMEVHWVSWVWQNGGGVLNKTRDKCIINEPAAVEALEFFSGLVLRDKVSPDTAQASTFGSNMFLTGRLAMSSEGSWMVKTFNEIESFQWDAVPLPRHKESVSPVNGLGNSIYSKSKHKELAWKLAKFLGSREYQENLAKTGTSVPAMKAVANSPIYLDGKMEGKKYFLESIERGRVQDFTLGFHRWEAAIRGQLELVWLGRKDMQTAMNDAAKEVDGILAAGGEK
ncbi:extracellular solute-binding protein [bacterium]|nr:extracellular solute-binding protein [bacterium]